MHDFVHKHRRLLQIVLLLFVVPPFALFGIDQYSRNTDASAAVAHVGGDKISEQEFNVALRERQETLQNMSGGRMTSAMLDSPELRSNVIDEIVNRRVLLNKAGRAHMTITDQQVQAAIGQAPVFQNDGKFSLDLYERFLKARNKRPTEFETELKRDLLLQQLDDAYVDANFVPRTVIKRLVHLTELQREAGIYTFAPERFESKVTLESGAAKKYYDSRPDEFRTAEQARVEYVVFSIDTLLADVKVDPEDVRKVFDDSVKKIQIQESRQASHILIAVDAKASTEEKQKARAKADDIYKQLKAKPASFADLAKQHSQDPGSAEKGGDLGSFRREAMVKPFADAAFQMKTGEISAPVESEYGYHIIKLTGITAGKAPSFEAMRGQIELELKKQAAGRQFSQMAEQFSNTVFEQSDSLKAAATFAKTTVQQSGWISRLAAPGEPKLNNPKLLQSVFSEEVLKNKRNSEVIEIEPGSLVAARLLEHKPSAVRPFEEVQAAISARLTRQRAAQLAAQEGRAALEKLRQGKDADIAWGKPQMVNFSTPPKDLSEAVFKQILKTDVSKLPAYSGVEDAQAGYTLVRISRTIEPEKIEATKEQNATAALQQAMGREQFTAYVASLKHKADVKISKEWLNEKKDKQ